MPKPSENPIFAIADRAAALRAAGVDVITLAAGEPDFATSDAVLRAAVAAVEDPATHHYGQAAGLAELRAEVASRYPAGLVAAGDVQVAVGTQARAAPRAGGAHHARGRRVGPSAELARP
jgi:aspartate aminotransferase